MNRCGSFPLLSALHSLSRIWTNLKRSEKIPGQQRGGGEWIWLTGPSRLHRNSSQGLNISSIRVFDQIRDPEIPITLRPPPMNINTQINYVLIFELKILKYLPYVANTLMKNKQFYFQLKQDSDKYWEKNFSLSLDFNLWSPVLRTDVLPLNH